MMEKQITALAKQLGISLKLKGMKMVTAESCTGGGIAQIITEIPGSSAWFDSGFVTYSNKAKIRTLQVKQFTLDKYGAISEEVAVEMVKGALNITDGDLAIAVTGVAGPDGGTVQKPVGTVYIAWKRRNAVAYCCKQFFSGNRHQIRKQTIEYAIKYCLENDFI